MADAKVVRLKLREMLAASNMETESQRTLTRKLEEELGFPLDPHKALIKEEIESFLLAQADSAEEDASGDKPEATRDQAAKQPARKKQRLGSEGTAKAAAAGSPPGVDFSIALAPKRFVTLSSFNGRHSVDVREWYDKDGTLSPGQKGLSLSAVLWAALVAGAGQLSQGLGASDDSVAVELGGTRRATVSSFGGRYSVDLREWYEKDGESRPGKKGISLIPEQWAKLTEAMGEVTAALEAKAGGASLPPGGAARSQQARKAAAQPVAGQPAPAGQSVAPALPAAGGEAGQANVDLGGKKRAVADLFKSKAFISLREYYEKDGLLLPSKKGISLPPEQFSALRQGAEQLGAALQQKDTSVEVALSGSRKAVVREFKGKHFVDVREFYSGPDGEPRPSSKGCTLGADQWAALVRHLDPLAAALAALHS